LEEVVEAVLVEDSEVHLHLEVVELLEGEAALLQVEEGALLQGEEEVIVADVVVFLGVGRLEVVVVEDLEVVEEVTEWNRRIRNEDWRLWKIGGLNVF
jgi:hypothetical protein